MSESKLAHVPLAQIREPDDALRGVDRQAVEYQELVDSIKSRGVMNPISVRELQSEDGQTLYGLVDGLQRYSASKDAGLESIPAQIISLDEGQLLEAQVIANVHKIETKPVEYSRALQRILAENPLLTRTELAQRLSKTTAWVSERLGLLNLVEEIGNLVDSNEIGLSNAYALSKLPPEEQADFVDRAIAMSPQQFTAVVQQRKSELQEAKRQGRNAEEAKFQPVAHFRSKKEVVEELESGTIASRLCKQHQRQTVQDAFTLGLKWAMQVDPESAQAQIEQHEERKSLLKKKREEGTIERKKKKGQEAAEKAAKLQKELEEMEAVS